MDRYNGNRKVLQYLARTREPLPDDAPDETNTQLTFNQQRIARAYKARSIWPYIIPLQFTFDLAARLNPYTQQTPEFNEPIAILGAIQNFELAILSQSAMNLSLNRESTRNIGLLGTDNLVQLDTRDFSGHISQGPHYFSQPLWLIPGDKINVDLYKTTTTLVQESRWFVFLAQRVLPNSDERASISADMRAIMEGVVGARSAPEYRILKVHPGVNDWILDGGQPEQGHVSFDVPRQDEPVLIRGFRSDRMLFSMAEIFTGEGDYWTTASAPVWSFANERLAGGTFDQTWQFLHYPRLLFPNENMTFKFRNSGTQEDPPTNFDDTAAAEPRNLDLDILIETL